MAHESTGSMPLDDGPLTREERLAIRAELREADRRRWIVRRLRTVVPIVGTCIVAAWQFGDWFLRMFTLRNHP